MEAEEEVAPRYCGQTQDELADRLAMVGSKGNDQKADRSRVAQSQQQHQTYHQPEATVRLDPAADGSLRAPHKWGQAGEAAQNLSGSELTTSVSPHFGAHAEKDAGSERPMLTPERTLGYNNSDASHQPMIR